MTQARLDKIPQQELLLEAAHALRIERDRQKELQGQLDDQKQGLQRASLVCFASLFFVQFLSILFILLEIDARSFAQRAKYCNYRFT